MVNLPYKKIIRQAAELTWRHKWLWALGVLAFGFEDFNLINFRVNERVQPGQPFDAFVKSILSKPEVLVPAAIAALLLLLIFIYIQALAGGGILAGFLRIQNQKTANLSLSWKDGKKFSNRLFGLTIAAWLSLILGAILLIVPTYYLFNAGMALRAIIMAGLAFVIFIPYYFVVSLTSIYAANFIVLGNMNLTQAASSGFDLLTRHLITSAFFAAVVAILEIILIIIFALSGALLSIPFIIIGIILKMVFGTEIITLLYFLGFLLLGLSTLILGAIISVWSKLAWALAWQELVGRGKFDEEERAKEPIVEPTFLA